MVYFEINTKEKRAKVEVKPGTITFDQFKKKLSVVFPLAEKAGGEFFIQFYDLDGILQNVHTDEEFQRLLSAMSLETHCRLYVCLKLN